MTEVLVEPMDRGGPSAASYSPQQTTAERSRSWEGPLFVVGLPRSGTKLLRSLLTRHPRIQIPDIETEFLPFLATWVERHGSAVTEAEFERLHTRLRQASYFFFRDPSRTEFSWREWRSACDQRFDAHGLFEGFVRYETGTVRGSGIVWGDKSPTYMRHLDLIAKEFPKAKVLHIVRDVRDYCVSIRKAWNKDIRRAASRWGSDALAAHRHALRAPERMLEIKYEELLAAPESVLRHICAFIGVPFDESMLSSDRVVENFGDAQGHVGILSSNFGKFRTRLKTSEVAAVESLAWDAMHALGYVPERASGPTHLTAWSLAVRRIRDGLILIARDANKFGLVRSLKFYLSHQRIIRGP